MKKSSQDRKLTEVEHLPIINEDFIIDIFVQALLNSFQIDNLRLNMREGFEFMYGDLQKSITPSYKLDRWIIHTLLENKILGLSERRKYVSGKYSLYNNTKFELLLNSQQLSDILQKTIYCKEYTSALASSYVFFKCCQIVQIEICKKFLYLMGRKPWEFNPIFDKWLSNWVTHTKPLNIVNNFINSHSSLSAKTSDDSLHSNFVYRVNLRLMDHEISELLNLNSPFTDYHFETRPDYIDVSSIEIAMFSQLILEKDAAYNYSTIDYIEKLSKFEISNLI